MIHEIALRVVDDDHKWYRRLLRTEWSLETLGDALGLCRRVLHRSGFITRRPRALAPREPTSDEPIATPYPIPSGASEPLREYLETVNSSLIPPMPRALPQRRKPEFVALARLAVESISVLAFPFQMRLSGSPIRLGDGSGFLRDVQAVVFMNAAYDLLPELEDQRLTGELHQLQNAMYAHARVVWQDDPSQSCALLATLLDQAGDDDRAVDYRLQALRLTGQEEHVYPTRLQAVWDALISAGRAREAEELLHEAVRHGPPEHRDRVWQLIRATFANGAHLAEG